MNTSFLTSDDRKVINKYDLILKQDFMKFCPPKKYGEIDYEFDYKKCSDFPTDYIKADFFLYGRMAQYYLDILKYGVNAGEPFTYPKRYKNNRIFDKLCSILMNIYDAGYSEQINFHCDGGRDLVLGFKFDRIR
jgi:hypothetical protein